MMNNKYRIQSLHIKNYKSISDINFDFNRLDLIVFDGPNGYGKTTVFEAIEVILSKVPRGVRSLDIDTRGGFENSPIHKDSNFPIELTLILGRGKDSITIHRFFEPLRETGAIQVDNNIKKIFENSSLYINDEISSEEALAKILDFPSIDTLFNVLNYVEQDENTFFLKKNPKERYKVLSSLLGAEEELKKLKQLDGLLKQIGQEVKSNKQEIKRLETGNKKLFNFEESDTSYQRLIHSRDLIWDREKIADLNIDVHNSFHIEIDNVKKLFANRRKLADIYLFTNLDNLSSNEGLNKIIKYYWGLVNYGVLEKENSDRIKYARIIRTNDIVLDFIEKSDYTNLLKEDSITFLKEQIEDLNIDILKSKLSSLIALIASLGIQDAILNDLKTRQKELLSIIENHKEVVSLKDGECPTCGYNWSSSEDLNNNIKKTLDKIFENFVANNASLERLKVEIDNDYFKVIKLKLIESSERLRLNIEQLISKEDFDHLNEIGVPFNPNLEKFLNLFNKDTRKEIEELINMRIIENTEQVKESIDLIIAEYKPQLELTNDQIKFYLETHKYYFDARMDFLDNLSLEEIENKRKYITSQYYLSVNNRLRNLTQEVERLSNIETKVEEVVVVFNNKIKGYTKNIIDAVTIPFYIFTGKILQQHSLGSGLVLDLDIRKSVPQLKINPKNRDQEVSYTLSSGQLSATVISLLLVLNRVYGKSKFGAVLIDDPLQTLDDINTHSLIEVLKYNFKDQQVVLSTHEERYSRLLRYKYDRFKLEGKNFPMKDLV